MKKRISWITPEAYIDVDLPIIRELSRIYEIYWQVVLTSSSSIDYERMIDSQLGIGGNVVIQYVKLKYRYRSVRLIPVYLGMLRAAKRFSPDLFYISFYALPFGIVLYRLMLPLKKVVVACHNVSTPRGATSESTARVYTYLWLSAFKNIQVFSNSQRQELEKRFSKKNVLQAPLALKDYGHPSISSQKSFSVVNFLFFGNILSYKRLDLLIDAAQKLWERDVRNFKVIIAGRCKDWKKYELLIRYPEIFDTRIERIPNEDIANLFEKSHYFVMPYQDIAQSGAITVAFRYNVPTIVSDIKAFKEFVVPGKTGLTFASEDSDALSTVLEQAAKISEEDYMKLCEAQKNFTEQNLSLQSIVAKYIAYFEALNDK